MNNAADKALELILAEGDRSWKHMVDSGTTISWEAWDLKYKPNQDWNHAWGAAPANLLPRYVLGVQPAAPGWTTATIRPCPGDLTFAKGKVPMAKGAIDVEWSQDETFKMSLSLPDGVTAKLELPCGSAASTVLVDGQEPTATFREGHWFVSDEVSGTVRVEVK